MNGQYGSIRDSDLYSILLAQSKAMTAQYSAVVDRKFWELIGDSDADEV
jgi:hypothetical protein